MSPQNDKILARIWVCSVTDPRKRIQTGEIHHMNQVDGSLPFTLTIIHVLMSRYSMRPKAILLPLKSLCLAPPVIFRCNSPLMSLCAARWLRAATEAGNRETTGA